jgi:hypothetical protein
VFAKILSLPVAMKELLLFILFSVVHCQNGKNKSYKFIKFISLEISLKKRQ